MRQTMTITIDTKIKDVFSDYCFKQKVKMSAKIRELIQEELQKNANVIFVTLSDEVNELCEKHFKTDEEFSKFVCKRLREEFGKEDIINEVSNGTQRRA